MRLREETGMDYSDTEYGYEYSDTQEMLADAEGFDSQHRLVGGRTEK